jgi:hypothetical protein
VGRVRPHCFAQLGLACSLWRTPAANPIPTLSIASTVLCSLFSDSYRNQSSILVALSNPAKNPKTHDERDHNVQQPARTDRRPIALTS